MVSCPFWYIDAVIDSSATLTVNGTIDARLFQIFGGKGKVTTTTVNKCKSIAYPEWFGAVGDGVANDEKAMSQALNLSSQINWTGLYYSDSDLVVNDTCFTIQRLKLKNTTLVIDASGREFRERFIKNTSIIFDKVNDSIVNGSIGLHLKRDINDCESIIRNLLIDNIYIENCDYGVYANTNHRFHSLGTVILSNSILRDCNYSIYFEELDDDIYDPDGSTTNICDTSENEKPITNSINDITITNNVFYSVIKDVYMKSSDGVLIANNTFFGNTGRKTKSVHLGDNLSDQIKIHDNQIFEPQEEGILIERVKSFQIDNNNIVASVNLTKLSSKIRVQTDGLPIESTIRGNIIRKATTNGIEIIDVSQGQNLRQSIFVNSNVIYTQAYGIVEGKGLDTINHYGVQYDGKDMYLNGVNHAIKIEEDDQGKEYYTEISNKDVKYKIERRNNFSKYPSSNIMNKTIEFPGVNKVGLVKFPGDRYSHFLKIHCWREGKEAIEKDNVNSATYLLLVSETINNKEEVALISELGLAKFGSNPDTWIPNNWPAFNFSIDNNTLSIAHKNGNAIIDKFSFEIIKIGNGRIDGILED